MIIKSQINFDYFIIALTSWKKRINTTYYAIKSVLKYNKKYNYKFILTLSTEEFPNKEKDLPNKLLLIKELEILWIDKNYKSYKKFLYAMNKYPDIPIITMDDGCIYCMNHIDILVNSFLGNQNCIYSWTHWLCNDIEFGSSGYGMIFPPNCFKDFGIDILENCNTKLIEENNDDAFIGYLASILKLKTIFLLSIGEKNNKIFRNLNSGKIYALSTNLAYNSDDISKTKIIVDDYFMQKLKLNLMAAYKKYMNGALLNLDNPTKFTEKIQYLKIFDVTDLKTYCSDKILLRDFCKQKLGKDICIPILKIYNNINDINFSELPNKFVLKCNHGSSMNIICNNKENFNFNIAIKKLHSFINTDYSIFCGYELQYKNINRQIFLEQYMDIKTDYKFFCFNGNARFCQIITDRDTVRKDAFVDLNFMPLNYAYNNHETLYNYKDYYIENFDAMITLANILSKSFKFVRVDFYNIENTIYLSELTFTPDSGYFNFVNPIVDFEIGKLLKL